MTNHAKKAAPRTVGLGIGVISACLITTELSLTRLFSVTIWYHFAFLAISVALFGMGAAALFVHLFQGRFAPERTGVHLGRGAAVLGLVTTFSCFALLRLTPDMSTHAEFALFSKTTAQLVLTFLAAALPFLAGGFVIALAMTRYSGIIHSLYSWDLLGAGMGCLLVIPSLWLFGAPVTLVIVSGVAATSGLLFVGKERKGASIFPAAAAVLIFGFAGLSGSTGMFQVQVAKGIELQKLELEYNGWNSFSMVSVLPKSGFKGWGMSPEYDKPLPERKTLIIDMNAMTPITKFSGDLLEVDHVRHDLSAFVHRVQPGKKDKKVCVIGAGGGRDILSALASGAEHVVGVEINELIVEEVMLDRYKDFTGGLYERPDVEVVVDDGRGFVERTDRIFDVIHLSMVDTSAATAAGAYSLTENSLHTVEAFDAYLEHLNDGGLLSVSSVTMPGLLGGAGLASLARKVVLDRGGDPASRVLVVATPWIGRPGCVLHNVIVKRGDFTEQEVSAVRSAARELGFRLDYLPGGGHRMDGWIAKVMDVGSKEDFARVSADWPMDLRPATDDRPFFFYQNRLEDLRQMLSSSRPDYFFGNGLFILAKVALVALGMVLVFLLVPMIFAKKRSAGFGAGWDLFYVACLGTGFMCVEIGLIQKMTLFLGRPVYTLVVILFVLLVGGGLGSRLYERLGRKARSSRKALLVIAVLLVVVTGLWILGLGDAVLAGAGSLSIGGRILVSVVLVAPMGLLMGMPFPAGLAAVSRRAPGRIPWLWGINSATSVLGSVTAVLVSMHAGISATVAVGAVLYGLALLCSSKVMGGSESS